MAAAIHQHRRAQDVDRCPARRCLSDRVPSNGLVRSTATAALSSVIVELSRIGRSLPMRSSRRRRCRVPS